MHVQWLLAAVAVLAVMAFLPGAQGQVYQCQIAGDPHMNDFNGDMGNLFFPCTFQMANLTIARQKSNWEFQVSVAAASEKEPYKGRYFMYSVQITIDACINNTGDIVLKGSGTFTFNGSSNEWQSQTSGEWNDSLIDIGVNDGLAYLHLTDLYDNPVNVSFRPRDENNPNLRQRPLPGVFIDVTKQLTRRNKEARFPGTICSDPRNKRNLTSNMRSFDNIEQLLMWAALDQRLTQSETSCQLLNSAYNGCGQKKRKERSAVKACTFIMEPPYVKCLEKSEGALDTFTNCISEHCKSSADGKVVIDGVKSLCNSQQQQQQQQQQQP